jgi:hypothetical protein
MTLGVFAAPERDRAWEEAVLEEYEAFRVWVPETLSWLVRLRFGTR